MKTVISFSLWAVAFAATVGTILRAAEPETGRVLVLDNERTLEGDIERVGDQYRIRRAVGETWLPASKALCLCNDREEAYQFLRGRANLRDPDEHLRLARWCQSHGLRGLALEEVTAALELRPKHLESQRLYRSLQQYAATVVQQAEPPTKAPGEPVQPAAPVEFNPASIGLFVTRVQPILMNTCAGCHASGNAGSFKLTRTLGDGRSNPRITQQNLAALLSQVNRERPSASPVLSRAVLAHGGADKPPIKNQQAPAYRSLEEWIRQAVTGLEGKEQPAVAHETATSTTPAPNQATTFADRPMPPAKPNQDRPSKGPSADPFDPAEFNRQLHAESGSARRSESDR